MYLLESPSTWTLSINIKQCAFTSLVTSTSTLYLFNPHLCEINFICFVSEGFPNLFLVYSASTGKQNGSVWSVPSVHVLRRMGCSTGKIIVDSVWDFMVRVSELLSFLQGELKTKVITSSNESPLEWTGNITEILKTKTIKHFICLRNNKRSTKKSQFLLDMGTAHL